MPFSSYVALGDSFTEGVGDPDDSRPNGVRGWADRVAEALGTTHPDFRYANLAIRGRKMRQVLDEQLEPALAMGAELVSVYAGGNDLLRPTVDIDALFDGYGEALDRIRRTGAHILIFTGADPGSSPAIGWLRGRIAICNERVREIADRVDATVVDFWRMREYADSRLWSIDRIHLSTLGHQHMAVAVLDALGVDHGLVGDPLPELGPEPSRWHRLRADASWVAGHAAPWIRRRVTGRSSGDGLEPRFPVPTPFGSGGPEAGSRSGTI